LVPVTSYSSTDRSKHLIQDERCAVTRRNKNEDYNCFCNGANGETEKDKESHQLIYQCDVNIFECNLTSAYCTSSMLVGLGNYLNNSVKIECYIN